MSSHGSRQSQRRRRWRQARWGRRGVQVAALALFIVLLFGAQLNARAGDATGVFFRFDPLAALTAMLAAREWLPRLAPALATVALTLLLGRVWCGWICPLGTLLGWLRFPSARRFSARLPRRLPLVKYGMLAALVAMAALGSLTLLVLDPLAILTRAAATAVLPALDWTVFALEGAGGSSGAGATVAAWTQAHVHGVLVPRSQPYYAQGVAMLVLLLVVIALNVLADRFWCRYLCPLGGLLALLARVQILRPVAGEGCTRCGACVRTCRLGALAQETAGPAPANESATLSVATAECTMCLDCLAACPAPAALDLGFIRVPRPAAGYDPGRRQFLTTATLGAGAVLGLGGALLLGRAATAAAQPRLLRPPGAQDEAVFLSRCLRCGACTLACPTTGLQPALGQAGLEGFWTPVLTPRLGACDYTCTACGSVCPSGAIPALDLTTKQRQVLGGAAIDTQRCLPWSLGTPCTVCEEVCPVPEKAIVLAERRIVTWADGRQDYVGLPRVVTHRCIGCGLCENLCPVDGPAAIAVWRHAPGGGRGRGRAGGSGEGTNAGGPS